MCGISFIFKANGATPTAQSIGNMVEALKHRGPDEQNHSLRGNVALGHTRLSIVDVRGGSQPMVSDDERFAIVFNGEIYNFSELREQLMQQGVQFNGHSDTEVLLQMYIRDGEQCVSQLRGMFSFAIHDSQTGSLFVARDRFGIKPLFYHWDGSTLTGASEMKSIFASGNVRPEFNLHTLRNYFNYQFNIAPHTCFKNIVQLLPGHTMMIKGTEEPRLNQYWDMEFPQDDEYEEHTEEQWTDKFANALDDSAVSHMIGDVPIGAYLSGGIDSSTTTYLLKQHYPQSVQTFTMRFLNPDADESAISRKTAEHLGVPNEELTVDDDREGGYLDVLEKALYHMEQPQRLALEVPLFMLSDMVQKHNYKVVYTGDGADEIMGGYDCFRQDSFRIAGNSRDPSTDRLQFYQQEYGNYFSTGFLGMLSDLHQSDRQQQTIDRFGCYPAWNDFWHILDGIPQKVFTADFLDATHDDTQMETLLAQVRPKIEGLHPLNQSLYLETKTRLPDWILWKTDRMTMAHGVEARVPFLDHPLVELTNGMPPWLKLNGMDEKYVLRNAMLHHMPEHPYAFKKRAFYTPIREWLFAPDNVEQTQGYLSEISLKKAGIFNTSYVRQLLDEISEFGRISDMETYFKAMKIEWSLMLVLSIQILHHQFIEENAQCFHRDSAA